LRVHDPHVKEFEYESLGLEESVRGSDCMVLITDHAEFKEIEPAKIFELMRNRNVVDTRNILNYETWKRMGFSVKMLGMGDYEKT
jgi:UDP-N-acetyl-D-mannosaminuronic acid dehydrogenase